MIIDPRKARECLRMDELDELIVGFILRDLDRLLRWIIQKNE